MKLLFLRMLMVVIAALILIVAAAPAQAVPIAHTVTLAAPQPTIIGYQRVSTGKHWTWHGRTRKWTTIPIYATAAPIPEPQNYAMMLAGLCFVAWRYKRRSA